jgi:tRNA pseudouridine55 synthase
MAGSFTGVIEQTPPAYSAVKYKGVRAYKLARKGMKVNLKKKTVTVHSFRILSVDLPDITTEIKCSSGTYIRSLAADFGREIGSGAHLKSLRRLASGSFKVEDALGSNRISPDLRRGALKERVIPLKDAVPMLYETSVKCDFAKKIRHGYQPAWDELFLGLDPIDVGEGLIKLVMGDDLVAVARVRKGRDKNNIRVDKVFH